MIAREQVKAEIDRLDDRYNETGQQLSDILQEIADSGGLGISAPVTCQREVRQDHALPFRNN